MEKTEPAKWHTLGAYVACYALYIVLIIPGIVAVFLIWRNVILALLGAFMAGNQMNDFIYLVSVALLGLAAFVLVLAAGPYLHSGVERRRLMRHFGRLVIPLVIAAAVALLVLTII